MIKNFEEDLDMVLKNTLNCWEDVRGKTIFITGGTGFFGIWLQMSFIYINRKLNLDSRLILLTRDKKKFLSKYPWLKKYSELYFHEGDIIDFDFIDDQIDYVIHAATEASVKLNEEEPLRMFNTIVNGTKRVLEFARFKKVKSFLLTSSGAVYGSQPSEIENMPEYYSGAPAISEVSSVYGEGKRMAEVLGAVYFNKFGLPVKIARCYAFMGPFLPLNAHFAAGNFIENVLKGEDIIISGDGKPFRSYMYSADLMIWLWTILFKGTDNSAYNVGSDQPLSILELAQLISRYGNSELKVIVQSPTSCGSPKRYIPNINKARIDLNLSIYTDIETCIKKTIGFNRINLESSSFS